MLTVRFARPEELPGIIQRSVETAWSQLVSRDLVAASAEAVAGQVERMYQMALGAPHGAILAADWPDGTAGAGPAAHVLLMPQPNPFTGAGEVVVLDIHVDPRLRGRRVGRVLLQYAGQYARSIGCPALAAQVALHNRSSLQMLLGSGFQSERLVLGRPC